VNGRPRFGVGVIGGLLPLLVLGLLTVLRMPPAEPASSAPARTLKTLFYSGPTSPVGDGPCSVAVADLNGDGAPDLVTANGDGDVVMHVGGIGLTCP
jgi:hypothetical protein